MTTCSTCGGTGKVRVEDGSDYTWNSEKNLLERIIRYVEEDCPNCINGEV